MCLVPGMNTLIAMLLDPVWSKYEICLVHGSYLQESPAMGPGILLLLDPVLMVGNVLIQYMGTWVIRFRATGQESPAARGMTHVPGTW